MHLACYRLVSAISLIILLSLPPSSALFPYTTLFRSVAKGSPAPPGGSAHRGGRRRLLFRRDLASGRRIPPKKQPTRSEEHTSELQSHSEVVCRLLLEKTKMSPGDASGEQQQLGRPEF